MHEAAVARLSKTLDNLLNGGMRESDEHRVYWEDTDEKTFLRFGEWAYTGDYKPEEPEILLDSSQIDDGLPKIELIHEPAAKSLALFKPDETENDVNWQHCRRKLTNGYTTTVACGECNSHFTSSYCPSCGSARYSNCKLCRGVSGKEKKQAMIDKFNNNSAYASPTTTHTPRKNTESCEDYSEVFLSHARLYTLADKYDIPDLRNFSIHKLYATLKEFALYPGRMGDIIGLAKYSFTNTIVGDKLRTLLANYCACIVEDICKRQDFQELINEAPDFACELIREMSVRLD
ncbi:hypothetical protein TrVFT333_009541 [Trichoderma virens FT-333]|nr:hypothetical protein TrVFT333_009541 [Trichoderma virens FT-333]